MKQLLARLFAVGSTPVPTPASTSASAPAPTAVGQAAPATLPRRPQHIAQTLRPAARAVPQGPTSRLHFKSASGNQAVASALAAWVEGSPPDEKRFREIAARKIRQSVDQQNKELNLSSLRLTALPACLQHLDAVEELWLDFNAIRELPLLPTALRKLHVRDNELAALPPLPDSLVVLIADHNQLSRLPDLPAGLRILDVGQNCLAELPAPPTILRMVNARANRITTLPAGFETAMTGGYLNLEHNPLSARALARLRKLPAAVNIVFDGSSRIAEVRTIKADSPFYKLQALLLPFGGEPNGTEFLRLFNVLESTAEAQAPALRPALIARVTALVEAMQGFPELRELCFAIAVGATDACADRSTLALNDLQMAFLNHHAEQGLLDEAALLELGQALCRMDAVDKIVSAKAAALPAGKGVVSRIEMRLGYHTRLAEPLQLPGVAGAMLYKMLTGIDDADIASAIATVQAKADGQGLVEFLTTWRPWQSAMEKRCAAEVAALESDFASAREAIAVKPDNLSEQHWIEAFERQKASEREAANDFMTHATEAFIAQSRAREKAIGGKALASS